MADGQEELTTAQAADYLKYSPVYFHKLTKRIPHRKTSGILFFKIADLDAFRESQTIQRVPQGDA